MGCREGAFYGDRKLLPSSFKYCHVSACLTLDRSTRNQRIERMWVDLGIHFVRQWRAFFYRLERIHGLDNENHAHLWLLHHIFLRLINEDCIAFEETWNSHPVSGEGHDQTPRVCGVLLIVID